MSVKFSIIVPCYKSSATINRLLASIPKRDDLEVIIVDDYSPMDEFLRIEYLASNYSFAQLLRSSQNFGAGHTRNMGLERATGDWLIFADADDYFTDLLPDILDIHKNNFTADVIFFNATSIKEDGNISQRHKRIDKLIKTNDERSLRYSFHGPVCKLVRRDLIKRHHIKFDDTKAFNDALFSAKVGHYAKKVLIDQTIGYCITESNYSTTYTISKEILENRIIATIHANQFFQQMGLNEFKMPIFTHIIYARKVSISFLIELWFYYLKNK